MAEHADIAVAPLRRALLDGIEDPTVGPGHRVDLAILPCFCDERPLQGLLGLVDWRWNGHLSAVLRDGFFTAQATDALLIPGPRTVPMRRLVLLGLGRRADFDRATAEATGARVVAVVERLDPDDVLVAMPGTVSERAVVEAMFHGLTRALTPSAAESDDVVAQPAARAVGEDASVGLRVEPPVDPDPPQVAAASSEVVALDVSSTAGAAAPAGRSGAPPGGVERDETPRVGARSGADPEADGEVTPTVEVGRVSARVRRWWVVADPRHEARLRRLLEGPPRAAGI